MSWTPVCSRVVGHNSNPTYVHIRSPLISLGMCVSLGGHAVGQGLSMAWCVGVAGQPHTSSASCYSQHESHHVASQDLGAN